MKAIHVNITSNLSQAPDLPELLPQEYARVGQWKEQGLLAHLLVKGDNTGAFLVFKDADEDQVRALIPTLPLSKYFVRVDYAAVDQQF